MSRRRLGSKRALLLAVLVTTVGFYAGIRAEKAGGVSSASTGTASSTLGRTGSRLPSIGSAGLSGAGEAAGTVVKVEGDTVYVKQSSGEIVKAQLLATTTVTKSLSVSRASVRPGDSVTIIGGGGKAGTITARSVADSGDDSTSTTATSTSAG